MTPHAIPVIAHSEFRLLSTINQLPTHTPYDRVITLVTGAGRRAGALDVRSEY